MGTKKTQGTIIFREDVSTVELANTIGKNFEGDIIILGDIYDTIYRKTDVSIRTNGGTVWIRGGIFSSRGFDIEADVFVEAEINVDEQVIIHGALYSNYDISAPKISIGGDLTVGDGTINADYIAVAGDIEISRIANMEVLGNICFAKEGK